MSMLFVGVDPGTSGALSFLSSCGKGEIIPMPTITKKVSYRKTPKVDFDLRAICEILREKKRIHKKNIQACIEIAIPMRRAVWGTNDDGRVQGAASSFRMGAGYYALLMAFIALEIEYEAIGAMKWQNFCFGKMKSGDKKKVSIEKAKELYPGISLIPPRGRKDNHNFSDSLLIAHYKKETSGYMERCSNLLYGRR